MPEAWEPEKGNESWSDQDAWRGNAHTGDDDIWRAQVDDSYVWGDEEELEAETEAEQPILEDWPENLAGPEYWLYKRDGM